MRFLKEGCLDRVVGVKMDCYIQVVDFASEFCKYPTEGAEGIYPGLEFEPEWFWTDPNANAIVDVPFVQGEAGLEVRRHRYLVDSEI